MRIVGGEFRSRTLEAPKGDTTRPTTDRVREALFSILEARTTLIGTHVVDLYAGTGALGLEALSRGAESCVFVEQNRAALDALRRNIATLGLETRTRVLRVAVERAVRDLPRETANQVPQLIFADPPYADVYPHAVHALATVRSALAVDPERVWILEHGGKSSAPTIAGLALEQSRRYGDTCLSFYVDIGSP
jgi:16S rRNA (guanine966-N2)-methyltransferase